MVELKGSNGSFYVCKRMLLDPIHLCNAGLEDGRTSGAGGKSLSAFLSAMTGINSDEVCSSGLWLCLFVCRFV